MNGLQLKGAEEEVEPVHGETGTLCDKHGQAREINTYPIGTAIFVRCSNYSRSVFAEDT